MGRTNLLDNYHDYPIEITNSRSSDLQVKVIVYNTNMSFFSITRIGCTSVDEQVV